MNTKRPRQLTFRATEDEYRIIKKKIEQSGQKQQDFLLQMALEKDIIILDGMAELLIEVKHQGNNLNQLIRKLHSQGYIDYRNELPKMEKEWMDVWQLLRSFLQKRA